MNIDDIPLELFEIISRNNIYPHIPFINMNFHYSQLMDNDIYSVDEYFSISDYICYINNKLLIKFYTNHTAHIDKTFSKCIHYRLCNQCVVNNYYNTLLWAINNKYHINFTTSFYYIPLPGLSLTFINIQPICRTIMRYDRHKILNWMYINNKLKFNNELFYHAIAHDSIRIIKWAKYINYIFPKYCINAAIKHNRHRIFKLISN